MAQYNGVAVELSKCYHYLGYTSNEAAQRAASECTITIPVFRGQNSQKSPRMVMLQDLAEFLDNRVETARKEFRDIRNLH
jgi:hypothetical protein